jgi:hypothetical protein
MSVDPYDPVSEDGWNLTFRIQTEYMQMLLDRGKLPAWPIDMTSKEGQAVIQENVFKCEHELHEACNELKNKMHRLTDVREFDREHFLEELADAHAFFLEVCIFGGVGPRELLEKIIWKNEVVKDRLRDGY